MNNDNIEEKMREWITWQKDRLLPPEAIAEYWLAKMKAAHLALLEQIVAKNETFPNCPALKEINTDLRTKIAKLKT